MAVQKSHILPKSNFKPQWLFHSTPNSPSSRFQYSISIHPFMKRPIQIDYRLNDQKN
jgi:hypothetical protein